MITVHYENYTAHINALCGQNTLLFLSVKSGGIPEQYPLCFKGSTYTRLDIITITLHNLCITRDLGYSKFYEQAQLVRLAHRYAPTSPAPSAIVYVVENAVIVRQLLGHGSNAG